MKKARITKNNQGVALLFSLFTMLILLGISSALVMRSIGSGRLTKINEDSLRAFYEAESGISYAYAEEATKNFKWYTHTDQNTPVTSSHDVTKGTITTSFRYPVPINTGGSIDSSSGCYKVAGRSFLVRAFPEERDGVYTDIVVLRSQATVNGTTRSLEYRLGQVSAYQYFLFFPNDLYFYGETYDGRNYGGIHVNGDIILYGSGSAQNTKLYYLTELNCGSNTPGKGYIRVYRRSLYPNLASTPDGEVGYSTSSSSYPYCYGLPNDLFRGSNNHYTRREYFELPTLTFRSGPISSPTDNTLFSYLEGEGAAYNYQKYTGTSTTPLHYSIDNSDLKNLAKYEKTNGTSYQALLGDATVAVPDIGSGTEKSVGQEMLSRDYDTDPNNNITPQQWNDFWKQWKINHKNDFQVYHNSGVLKEPAEYDPATDLTLNRDWERKFFQAAMDWPWMEQAVPGSWGLYFNREWWEDMQYGNDRSEVNYMVPARLESKATGLPNGEKYFLNTEMQSSAWESWLRTNNLNTAGQDKTLVQDRSQGGSYVDPGGVLATTSSFNIVKQKAQEGGVYIGLNEAGTAFENPIPDCTQATQFYNALHPARISGSGDTSQYEPSSVLKIDVAALKAKIDAAKAKAPAERTPQEQKLANFNGVIYVDLNSYNWSDIGTHYDNNADAVMLLNGARLPDGGLSIATRNNVYIKGDYNLDPDGVSQQNRSPDDPVVTQRYTSQGIALAWQPAEMLTNRAVYTVSNNFTEPKYMPISTAINIQFYDERQWGYYGLDFVDSPGYPTNNCGSATAGTYDDINWVPTVNAIRASQQNVNTWFNYYRDASGNPAPLPTTDAFNGTWVNQYWPAGREFKLDTNGDGWVDTTMTSESLGTTVGNSITSAYASTFSYTAIHGSDPLNPTNPDVPSFNNAVSGKHIYNTAIITPYSPQPYALELWNNNSRVINGAFIQLPDTPEYKLYRPAESYSAAYGGKFSSSTNSYVYETRYGPNNPIENRPRIGLTFGADSSWREINNADF